ncbi:proteasome inhibitor PI31 subunit-like protein [Dinothrombium tinctorium]|uniref:Proteasome inhibitor PI31 subunit n=1 Tax=Dinothrombium tinctorium TaxID=1965070 RepID=A0A3S4R433_9ACAR|nr:proteasome inhibitor PI31 subunit-like protein [Dinothrombium tinctorium]
MPSAGGRRGKRNRILRMMDRQKERSQLVGLESAFKLYENQLKRKEDVVVMFAHCFFINNGYRCVGIGNEERESEVESEILPANWNQTNASYIIRYRSVSNSDTKLLVKVVQNDDNLIVCVLRTPGDFTASEDIPVNRFITDKFKDFHTAFANSSTVTDMCDIFKRLLEGMKQESREAQKQTQNQPNQQPKFDPLREPRQPYPNPQPAYPNFGAPSPLFPNIGGADLDPFFGRGGGGMLLDPRSLGRVRFPANDPNAGLNRPLPAGAVPPGARFDPFGPPGMNPDPRNPNTRFANPDPDHMRPPDGYDDMFM